MAGIYWREAATLILIGRSHLVAKHIKQKSSKLINEQDYKILTLKRSSRSSFMPDAVVFPGGTFDKTDMDPKWLNLFEKNGYTKNDLKKLFRYDRRNEFYLNAKDENILPELAYRICALRETFEESGLLLANKNKEAEGSYVSLFPLEENEAENWRSAVHNDPSEFIKLFERVNALPSVFGIYDWGAWLTPTNFEGMKMRFDTIFYIAFSDSEIPTSKHDGGEIQQLKIDGSLNILKDFFKGESFLMPPQLYELSRFAKFLKFDDFLDFCGKKSTENWNRLFPVTIACKDGMINVLQGDERYPETPNYYEDQRFKVDQTLEQLNSGSDRSLHRAVFGGKKFQEIIVRNMDTANDSILLPFSSNDLKEMLID